MRILRFLLLGVALLSVGVAEAQRPAPAPITPYLGLTPKVKPWTAFAQDTSAAESWELVKPVGFTQMTTTTSDSLRLWSTSASDSTKYAVVGLAIVGSDTLVDVVTGRMKGTDTSFVGSRKFTRLIAVFLDTAGVGTISIKAKTGTAAITTIPAGQLQTYAGWYFFPTTGGLLTDLSIMGDNNGPLIEFEVRLYRHPGNALSATEKGYSVLYRGQVGGVPTFRPHVAKQIVAANDDTSVAFFLNAPTSTYKWAAVTTSVGTSDVAYYYQESPDNSVWSDKVAIDSLTSGTAVTNNLRYVKTLALAGGSFYRFIANGKAAAADTSTITTYITPTTWNPLASLIYQPMSEVCPGQSVVAVYVKAYGKRGRVSVLLRGTGLK